MNDNGALTTRTGGALLGGSKKGKLDLSNPNGGKTSQAKTDK